MVVVLPAPFGPRKPDDLALADREGDSADRVDRAEALRDVAHLEHRARGHGRASSARRSAGVSASRPSTRRVACVKS